MPLLFRVYSWHYSFFKEIKGHIQTFYLLSDINSPTLGLKLPVTAGKVCPSLFFFYFSGGRGGEDKEKMI